MKVRIMIASALALGTPVLTSAVALAKPTAVDAKAKITAEAAREIALAKVPGTVQLEELEKEHGRWIYSFEIRPDGTKGRAVKEVKVSADDGSIVAIEDEDNEDADDDDDDDEGDESGEEDDD